MQEVGITQLTGPLRGKFFKDFDYLQPSDFKAYLLDPKDELGLIEPADDTERASRFATMIDLMTRYFIFHEEYAFDTAKKAATNSYLLDRYNTAVEKLKQYRADWQAEQIQTDLFTTAYNLAEFENAAKSHHKVPYNFFELSPVAIEHAQRLLQRLSIFFNRADRKHFYPEVTGFHVHDDALNVVYGEGDYLASGVLYDLKVVKNSPLDNPGYRAQIAMYYVYGRDNYEHSKGKSGYKQFSTVKYIGFLDPRHNCVWLCSAEKIDVIMQTYIEYVIPTAVSEVEGDDKL